MTAYGGGTVHRTCDDGPTCTDPKHLEVRVEEWWVVDHDADDRKVRGPFQHDEAAWAVRKELERHAPWDESGNLWVVSETVPGKPHRAVGRMGLSENVRVYP